MDLVRYYRILKEENVSPTMAAVMCLLDKEMMTYWDICEAMGKPIKGDYVRGAICRPIQEHKEWFATKMMTRQDAINIGFQVTTRNPMWVHLTTGGQLKYNKIKEALRE